jgi:hypothetical protein
MSKNMTDTQKSLNNNFVLFPTVVQLATPIRIRAQVSAIHLLVSNLLGIGFGPTVIALTTDYGFSDESAVAHPIAIVAVVGYGLAMVILLFALKPLAVRTTSILVEIDDGISTNREIREPRKKLGGSGRSKTNNFAELQRY